MRRRDRNKSRIEKGGGGEKKSQEEQMEVGVTSLSHEQPVHPAVAVEVEAN